MVTNQLEFRKSTKFSILNYGQSEKYQIQHSELWLMLPKLSNFNKWALSIISVSSDRRRIKHSSLESLHCAVLNGGDFILLQLLDIEIFNETLTIRHLTFTLLCHLPFYWISWHPVIVVEWNHHHSMQHGKAVLMSCVSSFYDYWILR